MKLILIILAFVTISCRKTSDHNIESTKNEELLSVDSNINNVQSETDLNSKDVQTDTQSTNNLEESIPIKIKQNTFELSQLKGAWFDDPTENGLFYIEDSIFYLEANKSYPIWVSFDSLLIDFGYDIDGFRIYEENDIIKLVPLNSNYDKPLFRLE